MVTPGGHTPPWSQPVLASAPLARLAVPPTWCAAQRYSRNSPVSPLSRRVFDWQSVSLPQYLSDHCSELTVVERHLSQSYRGLPLLADSSSALVVSRRQE